MLKDQTSEQRLREIFETITKLMPVAGFSSLFLFFVLYDLRNDTIPDLSISLFAFWMSTLIVAQVFWFIVLLPLSAWVSRVKMGCAVGAYANPNAYPKTVQRLLDGWWSHEVSVKTLLVLSQVTFCVAIYRLLGPMLGIL